MKRKQVKKMIKRMDLLLSTEKEIEMLEQLVFAYERKVKKYKERIAELKKQ